MAFTDKHGRPEIFAQPFISKGLASARVVDTSEVEEDQEHEEPTRARVDESSDETSGPSPA